METPYRDVDFKKHQIIVREDLDQIQNNLQWIYENTPRSRLYAGDNNGVKAPKMNRALIMCGQVRMTKPPGENVARTNVIFPKGFSPYCIPHIVTTVISENQRQVFCVVNALTGSSVLPDSRGFEIVTFADANNNGQQKVWTVAWTAFGYRETENGI